MDLNTFGAELIKQLTRIATAAEAIEAKLGKGAVATTATAEKAAPAEKAPTTRKPVAEKAAAKPTHTRDEVNAALMKLKDDCGKTAAQDVIKDAGFAKMADITEDKFDTVFAAAEAKHAEMVKDADDLDDM